MYAPMHYYNENNGVNFDNVAIYNSPKSTNSSTDNSSTFTVGTSEMDSKGLATYAVSNSPNPIQNSGYSYSNDQSSALNKVGGSGSDEGFAGSRLSRKDSKDNVDVNNGVASMSSSLTMLDNNLSNKQGAGYTPQSGATDPGEDPIGPPIPVGDGWLILLAFLLTYVGWKKFRVARN